MISGTFHVAAQEWRYFSREKGLAQTLHLGQLATTRPGDTILVASTAPSHNPGGKGIPPFPLPSGPSYFTNLQYITNASMQIDCYGATNCAGIVTAQNHMGIVVHGLDYIQFDPEESGFFVVGAYCHSELHSIGNQGAGNGQITLQISSGGQLISKAQARLHQEGSYWTDPAIDVDFLRRLACNTSGMAPGGSFKVQAIGLGGDACLSAWIIKIANYD